jgi:mono/diheme cytochrome c family protein
MNTSRFLLACAGLLPVALAGCGGPSVGPADVSGSAPAATTRYLPRTDLMAVKIPDGAPARWSAALFPPLRSVRLMPNTPDADIAADLRKQFGKTILDPTTYEQDVWMPAQADRLARLLDAHFGTPAAPAVRVPAFDQVWAASVVRFDPAQSFGANLKDVRDKFAKVKFKELKADGTAGKALAIPVTKEAEKFMELEADWTAAGEVKRDLKLDDASLARGSVVYRRWCMQCHGPSGAGDAAYAIEAGPMPRDYRQGVFKYVSAFPSANTPKKAGLGASGKPRREDLRRTVHNGIEGTMMPAFPTLTDGELDDVVSYVIT